MSKFVPKSNWVRRFCKQYGKNFFVEVDQEFMTDNFNLLFLEGENYQRSLNVILNESESESEPDAEHNYDMEAAKLYGRIHSRFILTDHGIELMYQKFQKGVFGTCPRVLCTRQKVLPIGMSDTPGKEMVRLYCPKCKEVYIPKSVRYAKIDGAYFGPNFPQMLFMAKPWAQPKRSKAKYVPRLFGFKIHPQAFGSESSDRQEADN
ncbi:casein kinase II subunit beta'-like [Drosophila guanche]|uniref:Blast:Casein kinase II subunit beta n=1 Tax=Drosophila guanche TaxID=7266 RepID=A0A3B0K4P6_DROGU|nr:casein kinase II subunit beta'-like [Drosophila guanche]SPP89197.1 blast:Casein kinase II subunit beta' [Drosophila guanche]